MASNQSPSRSRSNNSDVVDYAGEDDKRSCMKKAKKLSARRLNCFVPNRKQTDDFANYFESTSFGTMSATTASPIRRRTKQPLAEKDTLLSSTGQQINIAPRGFQNHTAQLSELRAATDAPKPTKKADPLKSSRVEPARPQRPQSSLETIRERKPKASSSFRESDAERRKQILGKMKSLSARNLQSSTNGAGSDGIFLASGDRQNGGEGYESEETRRSKLLKTMKRLSSKRLNETEQPPGMPDSASANKASTTTVPATQVLPSSNTGALGASNDKKSKKKKGKTKQVVIAETLVSISGNDNSLTQNYGEIEVELVGPGRLTQSEVSRSSKDPDEVIDGKKRSRSKSRSRAKKKDSVQQGGLYLQAPAESTSESEKEMEDFRVNLFRDYENQQLMALDAFGGRASRIDLLELESDHQGGKETFQAPDEKLRQAALNSGLPSLGAYFSSQAPSQKGGPKSVQTAPANQTHLSDGQMLMTIDHEGRPVMFRSVSTPSLFGKPLRPSLKRGKLSSRSVRLKQDGTSVQFDKILIREYKRTIGDNPAVSCGPPLGLDWDYNPEEIEVDLEVYETYRPPRRNKDDIVVPPQVRESILMDDWGVPFSEVRKATNETEDIKQMRIESATQTEYQQRMEEVMETTKRRMNRVISGSSKKKEQEQLWSEASHQNPTEEYPETFSI